MGRLRLRKSEWAFICFFAYILLIEPFFRDRENLHIQPAVLLVVISIGFCILARAERGRARLSIRVLRDWLPIGLTLVAFREMELFLPRHFDHAYEAVWIRWDDFVLRTWGLRAAIEKFGTAIPLYLEFCYLLVYGNCAVSIWLLYAMKQRSKIDSFVLVYLVGTLGAYALFPFFPTQPPRLVFPDLDLPRVTTWARRLNLFILQRGTIHVGVFPSAHVSSAFSAAWGMMFMLSRQKWIGLLMLVYAISVSVATIYGRYHYAADVAAGFAVSLIAGGACLLRKLTGASGAPPTMGR